MAKLLVRADVNQDNTYELGLNHRHCSVWHMALLASLTWASPISSKLLSKIGVNTLYQQNLHCLLNDFVSMA